MVIRDGEQQTVELPLDAERETIELGTDARLTLYVGKNPKLDLTAVLAGEGAVLHILGRFRGEGSDLQQMKLQVFQRAPRTTCEIRFRAALQDSSASFFDGLVRMERMAVDSRGFLSYRALLLSRQARAKPIPRLEVLTKKVAAAGHEGSVGKPDPEQLFYLQSRGLAREEAEQLIVEGFLEG